MGLRHAGPTVELLFLTNSLDLVCPAQGLVMEAGLVTGKLPTPPKSHTCTAGGAIVFGFSSQLKSQVDFNHM
jgi:hypothetical protein